MRRRSFVAGGAGLFLAPEALGNGKPERHRWWPRFPVARELWVLPFAGDVREGTVLECAAGLAARAALNGPWRTLVYEELANDGYVRWFEAYVREHRPAVHKIDLDEAVRRLARAGVARGIIVYRHEDSARPLHGDGPLVESVNVATSLAPLLDALPVSEALAARFEALGLKRVLDVTERTEAWCLENYGDRFSRKVVGTADPKTRNVRSLMVAMGAFVCSGRGEVYRQALARCEPDSPVLGWGCGSEDGQTIPSSKAGLFQSATNWCHNLPVFAGDPVSDAGLRVRRSLHWRNLDWGDGKHTASYVLTDGDNVQWLMGNFVGGSEAPSYYANPRRGQVPFGWGLSAQSLAELSPRTLEEILRTATPNDDFVLYNAGGYFYPDLYGRDRKNARALELHADRTRETMALTGIRTIAFNFQDWDSTEATAACEVFARRVPGLLGILAFQYYPYSGGEGAIRWVRGASGDVPVVSCRLCLWAQTGRPRDTTPAGVAAWLNRQPVASRAASAEAFSFVLAHAWSRFRRSPVGSSLDAEEKDVPQDRDAPGTARGYDPVLWSAERLAPHVRVVTPSELLWRVRLRMRPRQTLEACTSEVRRQTRTAAREALLREVERLLPSVDRDPAAAERCFAALKQAYVAG